MPKGVYPRTEYHRKVNSESIKRLYASGYQNPIKGRKMGEKQKKHVSETHRKLWSNSAYREKMKGRYHGSHSDERRDKARERFLGSKNPLWKEKPGYEAVHDWIRKHKLKTMFCSNCGSQGKTHWANIDHKYERKAEQYIELCPRCHNKYDRENNGYLGRWHNSTASKVEKEGDK